MGETINSFIALSLCYITILVGITIKVLYIILQNQHQINDILKPGLDDELNNSGQNVILVIMG